MKCYVSFLPVPDDYRAILNATRYAASVTTDDIQSGVSIVSLAVFINNTYFQIPQAIIFPIEINANGLFVFEGGEESDVLIFDGSDPNLDPATVPILKISKSIVYVPTQSVQAGEYEGKLTVTVVPREDAGIIRQLESAVQITITGTLCSY